MTPSKWPSVTKTAPYVSGLCSHPRHFIETWVRHPSFPGGSVHVRFLLTGHERIRVRVGLEEGSSVSVCSVLCLEDVVVSGDANGRVGFWDRRFGTLLCAYEKHHADVTLLMATRQDSVDYVLSAGMDATVVVYRRTTPDGMWNCLHLRRPHANDMTCWAVCRRDRQQTLLTGSDDCLVHYVTCAEEADLVRSFLERRLMTLDLVPEKPRFQTVDARLLMAVRQGDVDFWHLPQNPAVRY